MKLPYLLQSEPAEVRLNRIPRIARSCAPVSLSPVLAGVRNDDLHVCICLSDDLKLMGNGPAMENLLAAVAAMSQ